ncbi:MAG: restriction endonuclease subunit S [Burkholderiaceae bacterium]|nr:restriction endonuclease subunit S [Burkholderiaceae bacterium]
MSEEKKLVPKLRFQEFRGAVGWKERPLSKLMSESRLPGSKGNVAKKITVKLWGNGVFEKNGSSPGSINTQYFKRKAGQFIYSKLDFLNQAFGIIPPNLDNFESTVDLPCFDFSDELNPVFLLEYVKRRDFYERLGETADGSRKARRIHAETFLSFPIALPSPAEQQKIADCLSSLDELIAAQARKVDALKTHKKGLMQQLFPREGETQPRLRFPGFRDAGEWKESLLRSRLEEFRERSTKQDEYEVMTSARGGLVRQRDYYDNDRITERDNIGFNVVPPNYITYRSRSDDRHFYFNENNLGITGIVSIYYPVFRVINGSNRFFTELLSAFSRVVGKYSVGTSQTVLSLNQLGAIRLPFPPTVDEQHRIANCLTSLDTLITAATQELETLKTHKKGLMQQLFPSAEAIAA